MALLHLFWRTKFLAEAMSAMRIAEAIKERKARILNERFSFKGMK
jgi:hypothetical protein